MCVELYVGRTMKNMSVKCLAAQQSSPHGSLSSVLFVLFFNKFFLTVT